MKLLYISIRLKFITIKWFKFQNDIILKFYGIKYYSETHLYFQIILVEQCQAGFGLLNYCCNLKMDNVLLSP